MELHRRNAPPKKLWGPVNEPSNSDVQLPIASRLMLPHTATQNVAAEPQLLHLDEHCCESNGTRNTTPTICANLLMFMPVTTKTSACRLPRGEELAAG
eukprot:6456054-Amphidinium_carterae.1